MFIRCLFINIINIIIKHKDENIHKGEALKLKDKLTLIWNNME